MSVGTTLLSLLTGGSIGTIGGTILKLVEKLIPDQDVRDQILLHEHTYEDIKDLQIALKQLEVNREEAKSRSLFVSGWRPFVGWMCAIAFCYHVLVVPLVVFVASIIGHAIPLPSFDIGMLSNILMGMLGLGMMRSYEKKHRVARDQGDDHTESFRSGK